MSEGFSGDEDYGWRSRYEDRGDLNAQGVPEGFKVLQEDITALKGWDQTAREGVRAGEEALEHYKRVQTGGLYDTPARQQEIEEQFDAFRRQHVAHAAQKGLVTSRAFDEMLREENKREAVAGAFLAGAEYQGEEVGLTKAAQQMAVAKKAEETLPEIEMEYKTGREKKWWNLWTADELGYVDAPVYDKAKQKISDMAREGADIAYDIQKSRPSYEQMYKGLADEIGRTYKVYESQQVELAQQRGMPESYIKGLQEQIQNDQQSAIVQAQGLARDLSDPNPQTVAAVLNSIYSPERLQVIQDERTNPLFGVLGGVAGGIIGGVATRSPAGAMLGYGIGSGVGQAAGGIYG